MNLNVLLGIDPVESISDQLARRVMQLRRKLGAGRARPYDRDLQLLRAQDVGLRMAADIGIHQAAVEACREWRVQRYRMLAHTGGAEIVALAAHCDNERIVTKAAHRRDLAAFVINVGRHVDFTSLPIEANHLANAIAEAMPMRLRQEVDFVDCEIHTSGGDLVQQGLPKMRARFVNQGDIGELAPAELVPQLGHKLETAGAAADHNDSVKIGALAGHFQAPSRHSAAILTLSRAPACAASTTARAVMLRMPRTVAVCVRMCADFAVPRRMGPTVMPPPAATRKRLYAMLPASRLGIINRFASAVRAESGKTRSSTRLRQCGIAVHLSFDREIGRSRLNERERVAHFL